MITIVGAGPAGSYLAQQLLKNGQEVTLIEEHEHVGSPVQCTGIVTESINKFVRIPKNIIANSCSKVKVVSNDNEIITKTTELVLWRNKLDAYLCEQAIDAGAKLLTSHQFISFESENKKGKTIKLKVKNKINNEHKIIETNIVVGADGPSSAVAKAAGLNSKEQFYIGMQAKIKCDLEDNMFETHFGSRFPDFFGWVVPEGDGIVRLGLGAKQNTKEHFYNFLKSKTGSDKVLCWESGIFPIYNPKKQIQKNNVFLIGDAATQVKATTGGGIIPSLKSAKVLTDCIVNNKPYSLSLKHKFSRELRLHLLLRNTLNKFSDNDYNKLLTLMNQKSVQDILQKYDRDTPIPLMMNLLLKEPKFLSFAKHAF